MPQWISENEYFSSKESFKIGLSIKKQEEVL